MPARPKMRGAGASDAAGGGRSAQLTELAPGRWRLDGDLSLAAVAAVAAQVPTADDAGRVALDLVGVERAGSAGVALLLEWRAALQQAEAELVLHNVPLAMRRLAELANVDALLGLEAAAAPGEHKPPPL
jgi:phospholipid transport system transporter-binding protein